MTKRNMFLGLGLLVLLALGGAALYPKAPVQENNNDNGDWTDDVTGTFEVRIGMSESFRGGENYAS